ncbi:MAG TPA: TolC family protein [Thermoanaerobaculia bacterium]|nr:TolC family protein [Thermoanaerobaculia bacterium]
MIDSRSTRRIRRRLFVLLTCAMLPAIARAEEALTIEEAIHLAVTRNERALAADARVDVAEARVRRARSFFFPDVTLTGNYTRRAYESVRRIGDEDVTIQSRNALSSTLVLNQSLFDLRAIPLYRQARLERDSIELGAREDKRLVRFEAADAFLVTLSLEQVLQAAERRRNFASASLTDSRARFEAGLVSSNDVTRAELELATAEREAARARGDVASAYVQLSNLVNADVQGPLAVPAPLLEAPPAQGLSESDVVESAKARRLDLASLRSHAAALDQFAREPSMRIVPRLSLNGQTRATNESGISGRDVDGFLGLILTWSAFDGGARGAEGAERRALARLANLDAVDRERDIERQVRTAIADLGSDQASLRQAAIASETARRNADETGELYRQGLASALEVADANIRLFESDVAEARARYSVALAHLDLRAASGLGPLGNEEGR